MITLTSDHDDHFYPPDYSDHPEYKLYSCHLVEHVALELEPVARPDMLQQVDNLLSTAVLLTQKWEYVNTSNAGKFIFSPAPQCK